jgi:hypothetical protein
MARRIKSVAFSSAADLATALDTENLLGMDSFCLLTTTGSVRVFASIKGGANLAAKTLMAKQLVLCQEPPNSGDTISSQDPVYVGVTTAGIPAWFYGDFTRIQVQQNGGTAVAGTLSGAGEPM